MTHPSLEYLLVGCVAALVSFLLTPLARLVAIRIKAVAKPRDRDVHAVAIPRMGGVALFGGFALALFVAHALPTLSGAFDTGPRLDWVVLAGALVCAIGVLDDRYELDPLTKVAGQVLATGIMVIKGGVQFSFIYVPWMDGGSTYILGSDLGIPVTILLTLVTINAMNFIDGLDGLAAGVTAIGAAAFFAFSYELARTGALDAGAPSTLLAAALAGTCVGFLPHNFHPARIFMGDSGSMLVGMMLSAAATTATTTVDFQAAGNTSTSKTLPLLIPLIPLAVLALPFVDLVLAVVRRVSRLRSPFAPDKRHLHHRLLEIGHSHRRAVLLLYFWSALLAVGGVALSFPHGKTVVLSALGVLAAFALIMSLIPRVRRRSAARHRADGPAGSATDQPSDPARV